VYSLEVKPINLRLLLLFEIKCQAIMKKSMAMKQQCQGEANVYWTTEKYLDIGLNSNSTRNF